MPVKKTTATEQENKAPKGSASPSTPKPRAAGVTRIRVHCNCGFNNNLYIRGHGANLNWDKGHLLKNIKADEWVWETSVPFSHAEFKILINDKEYENGENHHIRSGDTFEYTPNF